MAEWLFTFGSGHRHPVTGEALGGRYVAIAAESDAAARAIMFERFGRKWSHQYRDAEHAGVERFKLTPVDLPPFPFEPLRAALVALEAIGRESDEHGIELDGGFVEEVARSALAAAPRVALAPAEPDPPPAGCGCPVERVVKVLAGCTAHGGRKP